MTTKDLYDLMEHPSMWNSSFELFGEKALDFLWWTKSLESLSQLTLKQEMSIKKNLRVVFLPHNVRRHKVEREPYATYIGTIFGRDVIVPELEAATEECEAKPYIP